MTTIKKHRVTNKEDYVLFRDEASESELRLPKQTAASGSSAQHEESFYTYGLYGSITLKHGSYLICVVKATEVGSVGNNAVYEIKGVRFVRYKSTEVRDKQPHNAGIVNYLFEGSSDSVEISLLQKFFALPGSYFSSTALHKSRFDENTTSFIFNKTLLDNMTRDLGHDASAVALKCIHGYFSSTSVDGVDLVLTSRRSRHRAGVRFFCRGANKEGYVSNFVETTQSVVKDGTEISYVQIRGSIPLRWKHSLGFRYHPAYTVEHSESILDRCHDKLMRRYKDVFYLNVAKNYKYERNVCCAYLAELEKTNKKFLYFNFDGEELGIRTEAIEKFEDKIKEVLRTHSFFSKVEQQGVIRTNCIDTLDRTNVTQFIIGRIMLKQQLKALNAEYSSKIADAFKKMWYENGNVLSIQYSGTPSIRSQIVLSNKYSIRGLLRDFVFSCKRYIICRFDHGAMQNSYNLVTGKQTRIKRHLIRTMRSNTELFFVVFLAVTLYRLATSSHKNTIEMVIEVAICLSFLIYFALFGLHVIDRPCEDACE